MLLLASAALLTSAGTTAAAAVGAVDDAWRACAEAIAAEERAKSIPRHFLSAIGLAESGKWNPARKEVAPWPWTVTAEGQDRFFDTKAEAVAAVSALLARNVRSVDVGCLQVNLRHHPDAFADLDEAFDPAANVAYGAGYLKALFSETGSWPSAAGRYHSATPEFNQPYRLRVLTLWSERWRAELDAGGLNPPKDLAIVPLESTGTPRSKTASAVDLSTLLSLRTSPDGSCHRSRQPPSRCCAGGAETRPAISKRARRSRIATVGSGGTRARKGRRPRVGLRSRSSAARRNRPRLSDAPESGFVEFGRRSGQNDRRSWFSHPSAKTASVSLSCNPFRCKKRSTIGAEPGRIRLNGGGRFWAQPTGGP